MTRSCSDAPRRFTDVRVHPDRLDAPLRWRKPRRVFVNSMSDLFHEDVPAVFIAQVFMVMAVNGRHTFQILTKRPARARALLNGEEFVEYGLSLDDYVREAVRLAKTTETWPLPNVWLGVSVEDQQRADERVPILLDTPAAVRFVSCEPLLGTVDLGCYLHPLTVHCPRCNLSASSPALCPCGCHNRDRLDWIIAGGESGPGARPMDLAWARSLVAQGRAAGVPVFVKQLGARPYEMVRDWRTGEDVRQDYVAAFHGKLDRKGGLPHEWPPDLRVRDWPA